MALATHQILRGASWVLFLGYVLLLIVAGAWGIVAARADFPLLLGFSAGDLRDDAAANLLSQYRFLRAMELGFGLFALRFRREIHTSQVHNQLFLGIMAAGVLARLLSLGMDGLPNLAMLVFLGWELVGVVVIFAYTRTTLLGAVHAV